MSPVDGFADPHSRLSACVRRLCNTRQPFIQLRGEPLATRALDGDDTDLLIAPSALAGLLDEAYQWVIKGDCHLRVNARRADKVELTLYSVDARHSLVLDLWLHLRQLDGGRYCLDYADLPADLGERDGAVRRLPVDLEASLYLQHLVAKRKDLHTESVRSRLQAYLTACEDAQDAGLAASLRGLLEGEALDDARRQLSLQRVLAQTGLAPESGAARLRRKLRSKLSEGLLAAPRQTRMVSIMGSDGAGKTTLAEALRDRESREGLKIERVFTGKHLYRKSWLHKLLVIFVRPLLLQSRENFDERLAPWVYLRACLGVRIKYLRQKGRGLMLVDRSLMDFLYLGRKGERPHFSMFRFLSRYFGKRIPTVHCLVGFEVLKTRKLEMSEAAVATYNRDMYEHFTTRVPTDYLAFNNEADLEESVVALAGILPDL